MIPNAKPPIINLGGQSDFKQFVESQKSERSMNLWEGSILQMRAHQ